MRSIAITFALALLSACASVQWNPASHHVVLSPAVSEDVEISHISMRRTKEGVAVFGELVPSRLTKEVPPGRVRVTLVSSGGEVLFEGRAPSYRIGKLFKDQQRYSFSLTIPVVPPQGSTIRLQFEKDR